MYTSPLTVPFSYSKKESESNDVCVDVVEVSNVQNNDRSSDATQSSLAYKEVQGVSKKLFD